MPVACMVEYYETAMESLRRACLCDACMERRRQQEDKVLFEHYAPEGGDYEDEDIVVDYWDLVQVRYHMLRALKLLRGEGILYGGTTFEQQAMEELEAGHRLNNHLMAEVQHVREIE